MVVEYSSAKIPIRSHSISHPHRYHSGGYIPPDGVGGATEWAATSAEWPRHVGFQRRRVHSARLRQRSEGSTGRFTRTTVDRQLLCNPLSNRRIVQQPNGRLQSNQGDASIAFHSIAASAVARRKPITLFGHNSYAEGDDQVRTKQQNVGRKFGHTLHTTFDMSAQIDARGVAFDFTESVRHD